MNGKFAEVAASEKLPNWEMLISRKKGLDERKGDIRTAFGRDYTRILHSLAYRRLKHKTQVFFNTQNDHICTRIEHVNHVESVSYTIAKNLGLNTELTKAIATAHDLGHAPFGHHGENCIKALAKKHIKQDFWHEKHGLYCVDNIELLENDKQQFDNLKLTYAVRDGIISHCGELDDKFLIPRKEYIDLDAYECAGQYQPYTWEACVVKVSDKIAYLGRDIEDAMRLDFLSSKALSKLNKIAKKYGYEGLNTTLIMHQLIIDLCNMSTPDKGIVLSDRNYEMMKEIKQFNYNEIYHSQKFGSYKKYVELIINSIVEYLLLLYSSDIHKLVRKIYLAKDKGLLYVDSKAPDFNLKYEFISWLLRYVNVDAATLKAPDHVANEIKKYINYKPYSLEDKASYKRAVLDFVAGMTDQYAIKAFQSLTSF